uniref:Uncharacterized protein n=1 Tax=Coccidioides posadasii RMSCC 3488 TaxID=454284 RepID=A0A0J6FDK8_COCPO|nr:hypothetical protein CPAG_03300 [Coccidioides posadasii RMSCC 3488]
MDQECPGVMSYTLVGTNSISKLQPVVCRITKGKWASLSSDREQMDGGLGRPPHQDASLWPIGEAPTVQLVLGIKWLKFLGTAHREDWIETHATTSLDRSMCAPFRFVSGLLINLEPPSPGGT